MNNNGTGISTLQNYFPRPQMPNDQKKKLLEMHKASRANAGIYVAVVLAVYVVLMTILLCRYARRQRLTLDDGPEDEDGHPRGFLGFVSRKIRRLKALLCLCCGGNSSGRGGESTQSGSRSRSGSANNGQFPLAEGHGQGHSELTQGLTAHV